MRTLTSTVVAAQQSGNIAPLVRIDLISATASPTVDIGQTAIDRAYNNSAAYTQIDLHNAANVDGVITSIEIWAHSDMTGLRVGTFHLVSGTTYKCRDSVAIGNVTAGSKQTVAVNLHCHAGDFLGYYCATGTIEAGSSGVNEVATKSGEYIDPGDSAAYTLENYDALSLYGTGFKSYEGDRILEIQKHREEPFDQHTTVILDNSDGEFTALDLKGYKAVISYGLNTSAGDEWSLCPPLWVVFQELISTSGILQCVLDLKGIPALMDDDRASEFYLPGTTGTIKTILTGIFAATLAPFTHCFAYTVDWDSEDSLIGTYCPKQSFRIPENQSRLAAVKQLLQYTSCMMRVGDDGHIHIFVPTSTGAVLDYQYEMQNDVTIDVGSEATDRAASYPDSYTLIDLANPANASGVLTEIEVWAVANITGLRVGTFYLVSGTTYKCRDSVVIGAVTAGSKQTFKTRLTVEAGDFLGCYFATGSIEASASGYSGVMGISGEYIDADDSASFTLGAGDAISLKAVRTGSHDFFSKVTRQRLTIPTYVGVNSLVGDVPQYSGYATDPTYVANDQVFDKRIWERVRLGTAGNAQGTAIAAAILSKYQLNVESSAAVVLLNIGAEALDYVKVTDAIAGDSITGNIGWLERNYSQKGGRKGWSMAFGFGGWGERQALSRNLVNTALGYAIGEGSVSNISIGAITDVGDTLIQSNDGAASSVSTSWVKVREILIPSYGYLRVKFDIHGVKVDTYCSTAYGKIYKNGVAIGTERSEDDDTYVTFSEDLSGFKPGDLLQLYVKQVANPGDSGAVGVFYRNFRIYLDNTGQILSYAPMYVNTL